MEHEIMTKRRDAFVAVLFLMLAVIFLRSMVFSKDSIGFNHDWLFPMTEDSLRIYYEKSFFAWSDQNLGYSVVYPAENILRFSTLPFIYLGLSGLDVVKIILVLALAIAGYSMYSLLRHTLKLLFAPSLIGGLLYLVSPVVFNKIVAGHIPYIIG
jgi:hypothetical protein